MSWNYSGDPSKSDKDYVRFLMGDTDENDALVLDEEIEFALTEYSDTRLAAALCLRHLAAKYSRWATMNVGSVSASMAEVSEAFKRRADELDPVGITKGFAGIVLPAFGGLSIADKEVLDSNTDAVQPMFRKGLNDIPGGPDIGAFSGDDDEDI